MNKIAQTACNLMEKGESFANRAVLESWRQLVYERGGGALLTKIVGTDMEVEAVAHGIMTARGEMARVLKTRA